MASCLIEEQNLHISPKRMGKLPDPSPKL